MSIYRNKNAKADEVMYDAKLDENGVVLTEFLSTCQGCCEHCEPDCYARKWCMRHHNTCIPPYIDNTLLLRHKRDDFFKEMKNLFYYNMVSCFRPHVSGEFIDYDHFEHIIKFTTTEPDCRFYFYTAKKQFILDYLASGKDFPKNLIPWASCYKPEKGDEVYPFRCYVDDGKNPDPRLKGFFHCPKNMIRTRTKTGPLLPCGTDFIFMALSALRMKPERTKTKDACGAMSPTEIFGSGWRSQCRIVQKVFARWETSYLW